MITIISDRKQIQKFHQKFHFNLNKYDYEEILCNVGYPAGSFEAKVKYFNELNIWIASLSHNRFWNGFGIGRPRPLRGNSLVGEINFPFENINRTIAGVFGKDNDGNILILHRGKIGGGKVGVGKTLFMERFSGDKIWALDGTRETQFCVVADLDSILLGQQLKSFIEEIYTTKHPNNNIKNFGYLKDFKYVDEKFGITVSENFEPKVINRTHGIVVNTLAKELLSKGYSIGKDINRDLFTYKDGEIKNLFEIKTNSSTQCIYAAIGQLLVYSIPITNPLNLIAVLPNKLEKNVERRFKELGIKILYYQWENNLPKFESLNLIL